jgi:putative ABC transport system permease protein
VGIVDNISMALKRLRARLFESLLMIIAIGLGIGVICSALALTFMFIDLQSSTVRDMEYYNRQITISSGEEYMRGGLGVTLVGDHIPEPAKFTLDIIAGIKDNCPDVAYVYEERGTALQIMEYDQSFWDRYSEVITMEDFEKLEEERVKYYLDVTMTTPDYFFYNGVKLAKGSFFSHRDVEEGNRVIVLGARLAERLFPGENPIGKELTFITGIQPLTVIGVLELLSEDGEDNMSWMNSRLNNNGFVPLTLNVWGMTTEFEINYITAIASSSDTVLQAERQINSYMKSRFGEGYTVRSNFTQIAELQPQVSRGQVIAVFAASLGLLIAAINILNLMLARLLRRTKEIGVLIALGSTRKGILSSFLYEAFLLGVFGAILGYALSFVGKTILVSVLDGLPLKVDYRVFLSALGISGLVSLLFGVYPAVEAAKINPVDALRTD